MEIILKLENSQTTLTISKTAIKTQLLKALSLHAKNNLTCKKNNITYYTLYSYLRKKIILDNKCSEESLKELVGEHLDLEHFLSAILGEKSIYVPIEINPNLTQLLNNGGEVPPLAFMNLTTIVNHTKLEALENNYYLADDLYLYFNNYYYYPARYYILKKTLFIEYVDKNNKY